MNVVMTGAGTFVEVQGTAEGAAVRPRRARRAARARREGLRRPDPAAAGGAGCLMRLGRREVFLASRNRKKLEELRAHPRARAPWHRGASASTTWRRTTSRSRTSRPSRATRCSRPGPASPRPGCPRWPTTAACASTRSTGCPACSRRRWAGVGQGRRRRNNRLLLEQLADVPDERRGAEFRCVVAFCLPDGDRARGTRSHAGPGDPRAARRRRLRLRRALRARRAGRCPHLGRDDRRGQGRRSPTGATRCAPSPPSWPTRCAA